MVKVTVILNEVDKLKDFVNEVSMFEADFDAVRGRYVIDGKSLLGMFSLNLSKPIDIVIHPKEDNVEEIEKILEVMKKFQ